MQDKKIRPGGNNELLYLIRGLVDRLLSSQTRLRADARSRRVAEDHPRTTEISPNMFESALEEAHICILTR